MGQFIRLDKIKPSAHIETIVDAEKDLKNGQFVELGISAEELGGDAVNVVLTEEGARPEAIVTTVHMGYGHPDFSETEAVTKAGKAGRAHIIEKGDMISFLTDIATGVVAGNDVAVGANGLGIKVAEEADEVIGKAIRVDYMANIGDLVVVRFN